MKDKIIAAALTEMEIHSLRFTMEDLTRQLHIGRNSLYKIVSSKDALIKSVIEYKTTHFAECFEKLFHSYLLPSKPVYRKRKSVSTKKKDAFENASFFVCVTFRACQSG